MKSKSLTITEVLMNMRDGGAIEELATELRGLSAAVTTTGKAGKVVLTIDMKPNGKDAVTVTDKIDVKLPKPDPQATMFYVTDDAGLTRRDPRQPSLEGVEAA